MGVVKCGLKIEGMARTSFAKRTGYRIEDPGHWVCPLTRFCHV